MALFDYMCPKCKRTIERIVRGSEQQKVRCYQCDELMERQLPTQLAAHCYGVGIVQAEQKGLT